MYVADNLHFVWLQPLFYLLFIFCQSFHLWVFGFHFFFLVGGLLDPLVTVWCLTMAQFAVIVVFHFCTRSCWLGGGCWASISFFSTRTMVTTVSC